MTTQIIVPLQAVPNQTANITLNNQAVTLNVYQKRTGLYVDVYQTIRGVFTPLVVGVIAQNANKIVRDAYLGFIGDFAFFDLNGSNDPTYDQIGSRFFLAYLN